MPNNTVRASGEAMPEDKPDLLDIADTIHQARLLVGCICMASASLRGDERDAISIVGDAAVDKLVEARNALEAICEAGQGEGAEPRFVVNVGHVLSEMLVDYAEVTEAINRPECGSDEANKLSDQQCEIAMAIIGYRPLTKLDERRKAKFLCEWTKGTMLTEREQTALIASMLPEGGAA
jgi:hypothetical protein